MKKTKYYDEFVKYYLKAHRLEERNLRHLEGVADTYVTGDPLMDNVHIYNNVHRRYAGFSKVLEDIYGRRPDRYAAQYQGDTATLYLALVHRITGSGASFESDHGYRNCCIFDLINAAWNQMPCDKIAKMAQTIKAWDHSGIKKIFTSIGNQIPPFNRPRPPYTRGGFEYLAEYAPRLVEDFADMICKYKADHGVPARQRDVVDWVLDWHAINGLKKFHFVLTAWVMDVAEYLPDFVDRKSLTYYGKNAYEALDLLFDREGEKKSEFYDRGVEIVCDDLSANPYDMEDVLCDFIRYVENYIPSSKLSTYDHLDRNTVYNTIPFKHTKGRINPNAQ